MDDQLHARMAFAEDTARQAGALGMTYFAKIGELVVEQKGAQDLVSNADRDLEQYIRKTIADHFPLDGIVGEEYDNVDGSSGFTWVIDPIDGTANFLTSIPQWCVILACVQDDQTKIAAIFEPGAEEMFTAVKGNGAKLNGTPMRVWDTSGLDNGNLGVGLNGRSDVSAVVRFIDELATRGGIFFRNSSGGLMLSYVAAGRLIGYAEPHMNAWDCMAGQLLIAEAGGRIEEQSAATMLRDGGRVIASGPTIFDTLVDMADRNF